MTEQVNELGLNSEGAAAEEAGQKSILDRFTNSDGTIDKEGLDKAFKTVEGQKTYYKGQYEKVKTKPDQTATVDESATETIARLVSQGLDSDDMALARKIAKLENVSLEEATKTDLFKTHLKGKEEKNEHARAQINSRRSGVYDNVEAVPFGDKKAGAEAVAKIRQNLNR